VTIAGILKRKDKGWGCSFVACSRLWVPQKNQAKQKQQQNKQTNKTKATSLALGSEPAPERRQQVSPANMNILSRDKLE
jgi:hypothetical protein